MYKPIVTEPESVWSTAAKTVSAQVFENRTSILEALNFHKEHGRPEDMDGKFAPQITHDENEALSEIAGLLTLAAAQAAKPRVGVMIATLGWIQKHPSAAQDRTLPGFAERLLAHHYRRADETKATHFPDILGFAPEGIEDTVQLPTKEASSTPLSPRSMT